MSEVFSFSESGSETLDDFNGRLAQYCADNPVVNVDVSVLGDEVFLSLMETCDTPFALTQALQPFVGIVEPGGLEAVITKNHEEIRDSIVNEAKANGEKLDVEDISILKTTLHPFTDGAKKGFSVIILNAYQIELEDEQ